MNAQWIIQERKFYECPVDNTGVRVSTYHLHDTSQPLLQLWDIIVLQTGQPPRIWTEFSYTVQSFT